MKVEVGKVYKCGDDYVKIAFKSEEHERKGYYDFVGFPCDIDGDPLCCDVGMFDGRGNFYCSNLKRLCHRLEEIITPDKQQKLDRIATLESELKQLKEEIENEG